MVTMDADGREQLGELDDPVVVELPLRGEWSIERSPADRIPSHGTDLLGQRYAYDLIRIDHRRGFHVHPAGTVRFLLLGGRTRDCYGWGQPVHAALDGVVVQAVDGVPERQWLHPVRESWFAVKNTLAFARRGLDPARLAGNHVIMAARGTYALYAHLAPGSVAVTRGQQVRAGEMLGRVGHTGNSTAPHLHFHLMDSADPLQAAGVPCVFAAYLVERDGQCRRVEGGIPHRRERIRSVRPGRPGG
jgi:murein DD-endopeptidase MepM/ murein hydrolase activator NlpD